MDQRMQEQIIRVVVGALHELAREVEAMTAQTRPHTPLPRCQQQFRFGRLLWPVVSKENPHWPPLYGHMEKHDGWRFYLGGDEEAAARYICDTCGWHPETILAAVRQIQAAAAWCREQTERRRQLAEEILRQQADALQELLAEAALDALKN